MELSDALEASGSYSKEEILERVSKFRDKLMQVKHKHATLQCTQISKADCKLTDSCEATLITNLIENVN